MTASGCLPRLGGLAAASGPHSWVGTASWRLVGVEVPVVAWSSAVVLTHPPAVDERT